MESIRVQLEREKKRYRRHARNNYHAAYGTTLIAVGASFIAGLSIAADWLPKDWLIVIAAIPGGVLILNNSLKFEIRSHWHWRKYYALDAIVRGLDYEGLQEKDASGKLTAVNREMDEDWKLLGQVGPAGKKRD